LHCSLYHGCECCCCFCCCCLTLPPCQGLVQMMPCHEEESRQQKQLQQQLCLNGSRSTTALQQQHCLQQEQQQRQQHCASAAARTVVLTRGISRCVHLVQGADRKSLAARVRQAGGVLVYVAGPCAHCCSSQAWAFASCLSQAWVSPLPRGGKPGKEQRLSQTRSTADIRGSHL